MALPRALWAMAALLQLLGGVDAMFAPMEGGEGMTPWEGNILEARQRRGGGSGGYESCESTYGAGYAQCYTPAICFNRGGGEKCCEGGCKSRLPPFLVVYLYLTAEN